jgi:hypothetical protein
MTSPDFSPDELRFKRWLKAFDTAAYTHACYRLVIQKTERTMVDGKGVQILFHDCPK